MDNQTLSPGSSGPFSSNPGGGGGGRSPLLLILVVLLGLGTVGFGVLTVSFAGKATKAQNNSAAAAALAASRAADAQKTSDDAASIKANESPYRAYIAPQQDGSFHVSFPKDWSSSVDEEASGTQVSLVLNPDFVRKTNGQENLVATRVILLERAKDQYLAQFASQLKSKKMTQTPTTVSGQPGFDLAGQFPDHKTVREVVVPVRDKVIVFSTEDVKYAEEFKEILAQAKIIP